ncbi:uncharacterized protein LOC128209737 isoform X3 [Mya arenaria]|uniref:uncharacterized protein LOC128209737 isoform X3 n=1 Tax=Mya arenaria TaxID=6604 RepID=UPI0022E70E97|nr:uncharacterized protein LOC128209737 isoform X3 [Mya arenaria]
MAVICLMTMKPTKKRKRANSTPACACCATATRPKGVQDTAPLVASPLLGSSDHPKQAKQGKSRKRTAVQTPPLQRSVANGPNLPLSPQLDTVDDPLDLPVMTSSPPRDCDAELPFQQPHHQTAGAPQGSLLDTFAAPGQFSVPHQGLHNHMNISSDSDSDDNAQDMPHFLQAHSANLLPGNGVHFTEPISTPIINQIPKSTRKDIWSNRFVDFASLLPSTTSPATPQYTLQLDSNSNISFQPTSRSRKITSIDSWTTAFLRFTAIYTAKFPFETAQLMKYAEIVRDIASRRPGLAFLNYDSQFRMLRQSVLLPWDRLHTEFWLMACTSFQQPTPQSFRAPRQPLRSFRSSPQTHSRPFHSNICWNYNKHSQCRNSHCNFPHICGFCKGQHPAFNCKFSSKDEADKALATKPLPPNRKTT